jgi:hypothetical protein
MECGAGLKPALARSKREFQLRRQSASAADRRREKYTVFKMPTRIS